MLGSHLQSAFPNLTDDNCELTSPIDTKYNCIAFAVGDQTRWWWPTSTDYWPEGVPRQLTFDAFVQAFQTKGYVPCSDGSLESGYEKVALYGKGWVGGMYIPTHASIQLADGRWASKLGKAEDVEHVTLEALTSMVYGSAIFFLKRPRL